MKKPVPLHGVGLNKALATLPSWSINPKATVLSRTFSFKEHLDALIFIARVTVHAQVANHHPEILYTFKKVKVSLTTHEVKAITKKDIELALKISSVSIRG